MAEDKKYDSVEQALVQELGARYMGELVRLGQFAVMDGDESEESLLDGSLEWLHDRGLWDGKAPWTPTVVTLLGPRNGVSILVYSENDPDASWSVYQFEVLPEPHPKRFHLVQVGVLVPVKPVEVEVDSSTGGDDGGEEIPF